MDGIDLIQYLDSKNIAYKIRGSEIYLQYCLYCENPNKGDYTHLSFNRDKKLFHCHKCNARGNLYKFMLDRGDVLPITKAKEIQYKRPKENPKITVNTNNFYQWFYETRGIKPDILEKYKVGYEFKDSKYTIIYQYYENKGPLFNRKYRTTDKKFRTEKDAESNFYGLQFIDFNKDYLHVCEGEDDCHALVQIGLDNVLSVPYGAGNYTPPMHKIVQQFDNIFLLFDNDPRGQEGARNFANNAGLFKCRNVILPFKDARDCLLQGLDIFDIQKEIESAEPFKHEEIIKPSDVEKSFMDYINSAEKIIGKCIRIPEFNRIVGGIRLSELTILTGHTGAGKSTLAYNFARWAEEVGHKCMIMSFENRLFSVLAKLIEIYTGERIREYDAKERRYELLQSKEWIDKEYNRLNNRGIYFLNKDTHTNDGYYTIKRMGDVVEYANKFFGVDVFIVDHLHYFLKISDVKNPTLKIDESIRQIKQWTERFNIHILLLVHPHMTADGKDGKPVELGLNCVKGASSIAQESDNFWIVSRKDDNGDLLSRVQIKKNRGMGRLGEIKFNVRGNLNTFEAIG